MQRSTSTAYRTFLAMPAPVPVKAPFRAALPRLVPVSALHMWFMPRVPRRCQPTWLAGK